MPPETGDLFAPRPVWPPVSMAAEPASAEPSPLPAEDEPDEGLEAPAAEVVPMGRRAPAAREPVAHFDGPAREFEYNGGVHLVGSVLWCDADRRHDLCFISHAHSDGIGKNRRILTTDKTVRILSRGSGKIEALTSPYRRSFTLGQLELELHPAGHMLGSAQLLVTRNNRRIIYTSDVNTRDTETAERGLPVPCEVLAIPATYGLPIYRFPPREETFADLKRFVDDCLEDKATPVLIANPTGTAQELMSFLGKAGYRMRVHRGIYDVAKIYKELGLTMTGARRFQGSPAKDEVVIFPPILRKHASIRKLRKYKTAMVTGRAVEDGFMLRYRVDAAFAISDTADHDDLLAFIAATGAREVYLTSGWVDELAAELRERGIRAYSLVPPRQLTLFEKL